MSRQDTESIVKSLSVLITGARPDEIVVGLRTQSKGTVIKIHSAEIPPSRPYLNEIREFPDLWNKFLIKLGGIDFFSDMDKKQREKWLKDNEQDPEDYFEDIPGLELEFFNLASDFLNLPEDDIEALNGSIFPARDVFNMFPAKPGSKGLKGKHTLIFRRSLWAVSALYKEVDEYNGPIIDMDEGVVGSDKTPIIVFDDFGITFSKDDFKVDRKTIFNMILGYFEDIEVKDVERIEYGTRNFTAASYKSLLQKIIRFRPVDVNLSGDIYCSDLVLLTCFGLLILNPGSFVPDIKRYVSGMESGLKRTAVSIFEDSFVKDSMLSILTGAFLKQRSPGWKPTRDLIQSSMDLLLDSLDSAKAFSYKIRNKLRPVELDEDTTPFEASSFMLDELKSFKSDLSMVRWIAQHSEDYVEDDFRPEIMLLEHCVDRHWAPELIYFYPLEIIQEFKSPGSKPYSDLLCEIFCKVTGVNPRRPPRDVYTSYSDEFENDCFVMDTREAQRLTLITRQCSDMIERERSGEKITFEYTLNRGWISGMLGAIEIKGRPIALVSLRPDDPDVFMAIPRPSRNMKDGSLTEKREAEAILEMKGHLERGIWLKNSNPPIEEMKNAKLTLRGGEYYIKRKYGKEVDWEDLRHSKIHIPNIGRCRIDNRKCPHIYWRRCC